MAYTPGPWSVHSMFEDVVVVATDAKKSLGGSVDADQEAERFAKQIVRIQYSYEYPQFHRSRIVSRSEVQADACLIAAVPDLYEAAKHAVMEWRLHGQLTDSCRVLEAAIAKAEGS